MRDGRARPPEESSSIAFGEKLLALLGTGSFTTSYKYALLLAILDAVVEGTGPDGSPPASLSGWDLGRRVLGLYWRQARPYSDHGPLRQGPAGQRDLVFKIAELRAHLGVSEHLPLEAARRRHVARRNEGDVDELRLEAFLFGSDRSSLATLREPLLRIQGGRCFYCQAERGPWEVDHFLPWSRWPDNRLDNLVVADRGCNNDKHSALPAVQHLVRWSARSVPTSTTSQQLATLADQLQWPRRPERTAAGARGLYHHQPVGTMLWVRRGVVEPLDPARLTSVFPILDVAAEDGADYESW